MAFHTDDWITDSRLFLRMAALAVRAGMSRHGAIRALTLSGAEMLDLDTRIGSLTPGKGSRRNNSSFSARNRRRWQGVTTQAYSEYFKEEQRSQRR